jgi:hypothetical protein
MNEVMVTQKDTMTQRSLLQRQIAGHFRNPVEVFLTLELDSRVTDLQSLRAWYFIDYQTKSCICRSKEDFISVTIEQI